MMFLEVEQNQTLPLEKLLKTVRPRYYTRSQKIIIMPCFYCNLLQDIKVTGLTLLLVIG
jgi:hypothetical protein